MKTWQSGIRIASSIKLKDVLTVTLMNLCGNGSQLLDPKTFEG